MFKFVLLLISWVVISGCSNKELYQFGQGYQKSDCAQNVINLEQYDACMKNNQMSYDDYQKERAIVVDEVSEQ